MATLSGTVPPGRENHQAAPPGSVVWRVVARDVAGNVATSAEVTTPLGSVCTA